MIYSKIKIFTEDRKIIFIPDKNQYLIRCAINKKVLHVGCTDYPMTESRIRSGNLLHSKLADTAISITGIDISEEGIKTCNKYNINNVFNMNAENITLKSKYDVVIAGDVIEHLNNPGLFLEKISPLLTSNGELIISVPSAFSINSLKMWFFGNEHVHKDHTFYFSPKTLACLCGRYCLYPTRLCFTAQSKDEYETQLFVNFRNAFLKYMKNMSPSIIMHFKPRLDSLCTDKYIEIH